MTEEEKIVETEKSREKYFYVDKEKTYQVLTGIATSFIGASLAILLFTGTHKPPMIPCGPNPMVQPPCHCKMMHKHHGQGFNREFKGEKRFDKNRAKSFNKGDFKRPERPQRPPQGNPENK